jgi:ATP-dependent Zn protease
MRSFSRSGCARLSRSVWSLSSGKRSVDFSLWERRANENADDAVAQQVFAEKLLEAKEFRKLRVRVESGLFAVNTATYLAYLQAMAALGAVDNVPPSVASRVIEHQSRSQLQPEPQKPFSVTSPIPVVLSGENELLVRMKPNRLQQLGSFMLSLAILYFLFKAFGGSRNEAGGIMGMLRGTHQLAMDVDVTFADVIGLDEAKHEVEVLVDYLHEPEKLGGLYVYYSLFAEMR